ncbi:hypothetical protein KVR01_004409 [Diaporthe batatas]|uniref:uncharacterized protein n=1 Tax=Diaporthe batatas TaxID=748121 RepID=UPI001D047B04|nr:uncharacterized protein KVR01_004409 [Diaporthe batatas]KAG8165857.1 hypothetical protein KVR01_004409 [Diaporthe batatas]
MATLLEKQINLKQISGDTYTASWHVDWTVGSTLHGGCIAAVVHHAVATHLRTDPRFRTQPHILNLHFDFLRSCERCDSVITITPLKIGALVSTLELRLSQNNKLKIIALATATDFNKSLGPSVPTAKSWSGLLPPPKPTPDFERVLARKAEPNWVPARLEGEIIPMTSRILDLYPRGSFVAPGICDTWHGFLGDERITDTYLAFMTDMVPSMSDTLMQNGGLYDAHVFRDEAEKWASEHPGETCLFSNTAAQLVKSKTFNTTATLDVEFKKNLPQEGLRFVLVRTEAKMLSGGRMDIHMTICNEDMELICLARQVILVLEAGRKFQAGTRTSDTKL